MKRILAFLLAIGLLASMGIFTLAADAASDSGSDKLHPDNNPTKEITVNGKYVASTEKAVYKVTIEWGDLTYNYDVTSGGIVWNTESHEYIDDTKLGPASGQSLQKTINVTNHSNAPVMVTPKFTQTSEQAGYGLRGELSGFTGEGLQIERSGVGAPATDHFFFKISGTLDKKIEREKPVTIGTLTVTISEP